MTTTEKKAKTAREALLMAAELLSKRGAWCLDYFALDKYNNPVLPDSSDAIKFCAWGAIQRVAGSQQVENRSVAKVQKLVGNSIGAWNNSQKSKRPVIAALRKAANL